MGGIIHVVQFQFEPEVEQKEIDELIDSLKALKDKCVLPDSRDTYIQSVTAGLDNSNEGAQNGFTHMVIMHFESAAHRDYYSKLDPIHKVVVSAIGSIVKRYQVLDIDA